MLKHFFILIFIYCFSISCGGKKTVAEPKTAPEKEVYINQNDEIALAGSVNFEDEESLTIYAAILKNVIGDKAGAYIGNQMDKLANFLQLSGMSYAELLRAGEGLILEFNTKSDLYFDTGKTSLNSSSKDVLDILITALNEFSDVNVIIETHTDSSGDNEVNMKMTQDRLASIKSYLIDHGIDQSRVKSKAFGENQPKFKNDNATGRAKNRRVEFGFFASESLKEEAKNITD